MKKNVTHTTEAGGDGKGEERRSLRLFPITPRAPLETTGDESTIE